MKEKKIRSEEIRLGPSENNPPKHIVQPISVNTEEDGLFPVEYNKKLYTEEECDDVFLSFYHTRFALNGMGGVYLSDDMWVYPDGSMDEW